MSDGQLTTAVREPICLDSLKQWMIPTVLTKSSAIHQAMEHYFSDDDFEWSVSQFGWGQSNPTYKITLTNRNPQERRQQQYHYVLRKKPRRVAHKSAHALHREYQVLSALQNTERISIENNVPIPRVYAYCSDLSVLGTEFYIMEYVDGYIFTDPSLPIPTLPMNTNFHSEKDAMIARIKTQAYREIIRVLSNLHSVDWRAFGLTQFSRKKTKSASSSTSYLQRQLQILNHMAQTQASLLLSTSSPSSSQPQPTQPPAAMIHIAQKLARYAPHAPRLEETLIHGDFKMDNLVFEKSSFGELCTNKNDTAAMTITASPKIRAVLDWELSTIGDPLMDLANFGLQYYFPKTSTVGITGLLSNDLDDRNDDNLNQKQHGGNRSIVERDNDPSRLPPGIPTFPELIDWYCEFRNIQPLTLRNSILEWRHFYVAFACYKNSVIVQGVAQRVVAGTASSAKAQQVAQLLPILLDLAQQLLTSFALTQKLDPPPPPQSRL